MNTHKIHSSSSLVAQLCLTLATPQTSLPGSSVHGILQARILGCHFFLQKNVCVCVCVYNIYTHIVSEVKVTQSYPTLCDFMDYTVHGILQARILE